MMCVWIPAETVLITKTASGQTARVELMKQTFCLGGLPEHVTEKDVHSVASVLKVGHIIYTLSAYRHRMIARSQDQFEIDPHSMHEVLIKNKC